VEERPDLLPEPDEDDEQAEEELGWEGDPDDLLAVLVEVKERPPG
jgi:hypothetical protein